MALGAFWYSPKCLGRKWLELIGKTEDELKGTSMGKAYSLMTLASVISAYGIAFTVGLWKAQTAYDGAMIGFWLWFFFSASTTISDYLFSGRPMMLYIINTTYYLVSFVLMGALFGVTM